MATEAPMTAAAAVAAAAAAAAATAAQGVDAVAKLPKIVAEKLRGTKIERRCARVCKQHEQPRSSQKREKLAPMSCCCHRQVQAAVVIIRLATVGGGGGRARDFPRR